MDALFCVYPLENNILFPAFFLLDGLQIIGIILIRNEYKFIFGIFLH